MTCSLDAEAEWAKSVIVQDSEIGSQRLLCLSGDLREWICMNRGTEAVGVDPGYTRSWGEWVMGEWSKKERPGRRGHTEEAKLSCIFFHSLTLGDPKRRLASSSWYLFISVLRSPVIVLKFFSFFWIESHKILKSNYIDKILTHSHSYYPELANVRYLPCFFLDI